jgi:hypothetical protein
VISNTLHRGARLKLQIQDIEICLNLSLCKADLSPAATKGDVTDGHQRDDFGAVSSRYGETKW